MSTPIGLNGGILVGAEAVAYGTEAVTKNSIHAISSSIGVRRAPRQSSAWLTHHVQRIAQGINYVDGEVVAALTRDEDEMGVIYGAMGAATPDAPDVLYAIGTSAPDNDSLTIAVNHGAAPEYTYTGCVPSSLRLNLPSSGEATMSLSVAGKAGIEEVTPTSLTDPSTSSLVMPGTGAAAYGELTIDGTVYDFNNFSLDFSIPTAYAGLSCAGATTVRRAYWSGPMVITGSIEIDFDDDAGNNVDTVTLLDTYMSAGDGDLTTILLNDGTNDWISLGGCEFLGDPPSLQSDAQALTVNFRAAHAVIRTEG